MGGFTGGSDNRSKVDASNVEIAVTEGGYATYGRGKGAISAAGDVYKLGKGARLNITTTDNGAIAAANQSVMAALSALGSSSEKAVGGYGGLLETQITGGGNLALGANKTLYLVIGAVLVVWLWFRK
jgi:hypothetical protein